MKLHRVHKDLPLAHVRATIPGALKVDVDAYLDYYQEHYGEPISFETLLIEIFSSFFARDVAFKRWRRCKTDNAGEKTSQTALPTT